MPYRIGVDEERKARLEAELERILVLLPKHNVEWAYLIGSFASGDVSRTSDIDLVVVQETDVKFVNRMNEFLFELRPRVGLDLLVYTPDEFEDMMGRPGFLRGAVERGRLIYEK